MTSLESRIEAAAAAAADEITPQDIPPLRLPVRALPVRALPVRARRVRSPSRWLAPLAAAASLAAVVSFLVVLKDTNGPGASGGWPRSATASRAQRLLAKQALDAYFPATGGQYTTGLAFAWTRQRVLARNAGRCLADAGLPQTSFPASKRRYQLSFPDNGQFPDLGQRTRTHSMAPAAGGVRSDEARPWAHPGHETPAARACVARHAHAFSRLDAIATPLARAWLRRVVAIEASAPVLAMRPGFVTCLESSGVPAKFATSAGRGGAGRDRLFTGFFAWMNWLGANSASPLRYASQQRVWTPVFVTCATPTVATVERLQLAARTAFMRAHARKIRAITRLVMSLSVPRGPR
jgi:hypothetical protein